MSGIIIRIFWFFLFAAFSIFNYLVLLREPFFDFAGMASSASVLTPYYKEDVIFSLEGLKAENEDGVSILFYLQKIYPGLFYS